MTLVLKDVDGDSGWRCNVELDGRAVGSIWMRAWRENTGPFVILCDWQLEAGLDPQPLLDAAEAAGRAVAETGAVFASNATSDEVAKQALLENNGYQYVFSQIEMTLLNPDVAARPLPAGIAPRQIGADDAAALIDLTERVWAGRDYFTDPSLAGFERWLQRSDLSLFLAALDGDQIVGYVAATQDGNSAEIEDLQVLPTYQRRRIGSTLLANVLHELQLRNVERVWLGTEGHDPAGARSLYESFGFTMTKDNRRFRKTV